LYYEDSEENARRRQYHTANVRDKELVIFGGEGVGPELQEFNDILLFDLASNKWKDIEIQGFQPKPRIHHASCLIGDQQMLLVTGGKFNYVMLDDWDAVLFDFHSKRWIQPTLTSDSVTPPAVVGHSMVPLDSKR
jgi:hypothetical protein